MARIDLSSIRITCLKPECLASGKLQRHHKGCQKMFVRHFIARTGTTRYDEFKERYHSFYPRDVVRICDAHHHEIHHLYMPIIMRHCRKLKKPMCRWTWKEAKRLMEELEQVCTIWLRKKTPGMKRRRWIPVT